MQTARRRLTSPFARLLAGAGAANLADGFIAIAIELLAVRLTTDPVANSLLRTVTLLPMMVTSLAAGILVDRISRRTALIAASASRALLLVTLCMLVGTGHTTLVALYALTFLLGVGETLYDLSTSAAVPQLVGTSQLERANSRIQAMQQVVQSFIAAPLAAIAFAAFAVIPFAIGAGGYLLAAGAALTLPAALLRHTPPPPTPDAAPRLDSAPSPSTTGADRATGADSGTDAAAAVPYQAGLEAATTSATPVGASEANFPATAAEHVSDAGAPASRTSRTSVGLRDAWQFLRRCPVLAGQAAVVVVVGSAMAFAQSAMVLYLRTDVGVPEAAMGFVTIAMALGALAGMWLVSRVAPRVGRATCQVAALLGLAAGIAVLGLASMPTVAMAGCAVMALAASVWNVLSISARQALVPTHLMGRVTGLLGTVISAATVAATVLGGVVSRTDLRLPFLVGAGVIAIAGLAARPLLRRMEALLLRGRELGDGVAGSLEPAAATAPGAQRETSLPQP